MSIVISLGDLLRDREIAFIHNDAKLRNLFLISSFIYGHVDFSSLGIFFIHSNLFFVDGVCKKGDDLSFLKFLEDANPNYLW